MFIKLYCNSKIHKISKIPESFSDFTEKITTIFASEIPSHGYSITYEDEECDKIALTSEDDYQTMINTDLPNLPNQTIKVFIALQLNNHPDDSDNSSEQSQDAQKAFDLQNSENSREVSPVSQSGKTLPTKQPLKSILKKKSSNDALTSQRRDSYKARVLNDCRSLNGSGFELCKNSFITVTRFLQARGQVEAEYNGLCGVFNLRDLEIQKKTCSFQVEKTFAGFGEEMNYRRVQIGF